MLRYRKYFVFSLLLISLLAYRLPHFLKVIEDTLYKPIAIGEVALEGAHTSIAYRLSQDQWLEFPVPAASEQIKVISNASVPQVVAEIADAEWHYALQFQIIGTRDEILDDQIYHHRSHITRYINQTGDGGQLRSYFLDPSISIADGRQMLLDIADRSDVKLFRLRLHSRSEDIHFVVARAYAPEKVAGHKLAASWQRMSERKKENLAKGNVYPSHLLSTVEKRNLLHKQWRPMGPVGVDGTHYFPKMLYSFSGQEKENFKEEILPVGLEIDTFHHGVVPIPEHGGELRLEFRVVAENLPDQDQTIRLSWFGRTAKRYWQNSIAYPGESEFSTVGQVEGGYLLIESPIALIARAYLRTYNGEAEITPELLLNRLYIGTPELPVEYSIHHSGGNPTPLRIDLRRSFEINQNEQSDNSQVDYQLLDEEHRVILTGALKLPDQVSFFDRLRGGSVEYRISDPIRHYLLIPPDASQIRLSHSASAMVNVYNRPYLLPKITRVPEDAFPVWADPQPLPSWFLLKPTNARELTIAQQSVLLLGQSRPPLERVGSLNDSDEWEYYKPEINQGSDFLFVPLEVTSGSDPNRDQALASIFCEIPSGVDVSVKLKAHGGLRSIKPQLVHLQNSVKRFELNVLLDAQKLHHTNRIARHGITYLPRLSTGGHRLHLETDSSSRFFMNHIANCKGISYSKRRVHRIGRRGLKFIFHKKTVGKEVLSGRIYSENDSTARTVFDIDIENIKRSVMNPYPGWTFQKRHFDVGPVEGIAAYVLQGTPRTLNSGQSFFIPFAEDLPPGDYRVSFSSPDMANGYLSLASRQAGTGQQHWIYKDTTVSVDLH